MKISILLTTLSVSLSAFASGPSQIWTGSDTDRALIAKIAEGIAGKIRADFQKTGKAVRDAHAKAHGCVRATFEIEKGLAGTGYDQAIFANPGKSYKAWIRFSNGSGEPEGDDRQVGARGMAIKVIGVDGPKFMDDEKTTQDFQMINHPVFFVKNVPDYVEFETDQRAFMASHREELAVVQAMGNPATNAPKNLVESTYFSMTPRQFGPVDRIRPMKFSAKPVVCKDGDPTPAPVALKDSKDALRIALSETLSTRDACFEFQVQKQTNDIDMPVDNPVKLWSESESKPRTVAKIVIKRQGFESEAQKTFCEDLSITPWHSIEELQPLGSIELTRKTVYETTSKLRHELNQRPRVEPTGDETFE